MGKVAIENVLRPGTTSNVDAEKFAAVKAAVLEALPDAPPGMTPADLIAAVRPRLPADLFPGGEKAGWWVKAVQLDQEAKGALRRSEKAPVRLWRV